ncbi:hypothetical protein JX265_007290 [Neoarthrinium moseri]|uniref:Major facilitator superfamily (MFS) profile domain-containing protein n=1 Tax=Neoarthrinium moseri TaxID=1658444 RepID=A0A9P9WK67_9PEZI|nr:hypothetical protein JX265_007290 [Neoarthrinium moseri]
MNSSTPTTYAGGEAQADPASSPKQASDPQMSHEANVIIENSERHSSPTIELPTQPSPSTQKLTGNDIVLVMAPLCLSVLLSSLDLTIVTPAIPAIVNHFQAVSGYIWVGGAFILANTAMTPVWGSVSDIYGRKPIMLIAMAVFLGGSLLCALAPTMESLIAGRAIQGIGASGMSTMVNVIICDTFSLRDRGLYLAVTSIVWAVGSAVGPVIGGVFSTRLDWRWCFWINMPIGAVVLVMLAVFLKVPSANTPIAAGLKAIDWTGSALIVGSALMILLGLQFGGVTHPWSSVTVISLIVFGSAVVGIFIINEWRFAINPVIPLRLFSNRSSVAAFTVFSCNFYILIGLSYYLPLYSQSVLGADALGSGLHLLPLIVSSSLAAACTGAFIQRTGIYLPVMYVAQVILTLGAGLFLNLEYGEGLTKMFIFEIITGVGVGMNMEPPLLAAQAASRESDTAAAIATMGFIRSIATAVAIVVGGVVFQNKMASSNSDLVKSIGAELAAAFYGNEATANVEQIGSLPAVEQDTVRQVYYNALKAVWIVYVAVAGLSFLSNLFVRAHHLSRERKTVRFGIDRTRRSHQETESPAGPHGIELVRLRD